MKKLLQTVYTKLIFSVYIIGFLYVFTFCAGITIQQFRGPHWVSAMRDHAVARSTSQVEEIWSLSNVYMSDPGKGEIYLTATDGNAFLIGSLDANRLESLIKIDMETGQVEWEKTLRRSFLNRGVSQIASNDNLVFVGMDGTQKINGETRWGAASIRAYDPRSSEKIWSQRIGGARSISTIVVTGSMLNIDGSYSSKSSYLDAQTGDIVNTPNAVDGFYLFTNDGLYIDQLDSFRARDVKTNAIVWEKRINASVRRSPILAEGSLLLRTGETFGQAISLDARTGQLLWEYEDVISNIAVANSAAFFLTRAGELLAVDIQSGAILAEVSFETAKFQDIERFGYYVAAWEDEVLVNLGDGRQLFAFHFTPNS